MSKIIAYLIPGILINLALVAISAFCVSDETFNSPWYGNLVIMVMILSIVIPCIIYYVKMPPGENTKP